MVVPGDGAAPGLDAYQIKKVRILYKKLLLKEKDLPSAVTHLDSKNIQAANPTMGSIQTLLKMAPSVQAYTQGPGQSAPTLAIRGVRNDELAETLDGVPINDLMSGSGDYLSNYVGSPITLNELERCQRVSGRRAAGRAGLRHRGRHRCLQHQAADR